MGLPPATLQAPTHQCLASLWAAAQTCALSGPPSSGQYTHHLGTAVPQTVPSTSCRFLHLPPMAPHVGTTVTPPS